MASKNSSTSLKNMHNTGTIVQKENPVLREKAKLVPSALFNTPELHNIITAMSHALASQKDGVALAAPQIGISLRIFIISQLLFSESETNETSETPAHETAKDIVCINPTLIKISKERELMEEGCLSVRYKYGKTMRAKKARIRAYDEYGREFELGGSGLLAQIFQHEIEHLDGVLFTDHAVDVHDMPPQG